MGHGANSSWPDEEYAVFRQSVQTRLHEEQHISALRPHVLSLLTKSHTSKPVGNSNIIQNSVVADKEKSEQNLIVVDFMTPELSLEAQEHNMNSLLDRRAPIHGGSAFFRINMKNCRCSFYPFSFGIVSGNFGTAWGNGLLCQGLF